MQNIVYHGRLNFDARIQWIKRGGLNISERRCGGSDNHNFIFQASRWNGLLAVVQYVADGNMRKGTSLSQEIDQQLAIFIDGNIDGFCGI